MTAYWWVVLLVLYLMAAIVPAWLILRDHHRRMDAFYERNPELRR